MHTNGVLLQRLFTALDDHDHRTMAGCYHPAATFRDIAFDLAGESEIRAMWHMICENTDIRATFEVLHAAGHTVILVTHDPNVAARAQRTINIADGQVV